MSTFDNVKCLQSELAALEGTKTDSLFVAPESMDASSKKLIASVTAKTEPFDPSFTGTNPWIGGAQKASGGGGGGGCVIL